MAFLTNWGFSTCLIIYFLPIIEAPTLLLSTICNTYLLLQLTEWLCNSDNEKP